MDTALTGMHCTEKDSLFSLQYLPIYVAKTNLSQEKMNIQPLATTGRQNVSH